MAAMFACAATSLGERKLSEPEAGFDKLTAKSQPHGIDRMLDPVRDVGRHLDLKMLQLGLAFMERRDGDNGIVRTVDEEHGRSGLYLVL